MRQSDHGMLVSMFQARAPVSSGGRGGGRKRRQVTVVDAYRTSLEQLLEDLNATAPHFVRCVKPNDTKSPGTYHKRECLLRWFRLG